MEAILHRDVTRRDVGNHLGDEEGVILRTVGLVEGIISGFLLKGVEAADTGSYDNAHTVFVDGAFGIKAGVGHSLASSHDAILGIEVELAQFFAVEMVCSIEVFDFAGKLCLELRGVKVSNRGGTALAGEGSGPCGGHIIAQGADSA